MASRRLDVVVAGDTRGLTRTLGQAGRDVDRFERKTKGAGNSVKGFTSISSRGFSRVGVAARGMQVVAGGAAAVLAKSFISSASDINESLTKNQVLFGQYSKDVNAFSKTSARAFGISRSAALEYTGVFGNLFRSMGQTRKESAGMSVGLTKLAADMASFNNTSIEDALEAIRSGLVGETEPLRRFGVNMNDAQLRTEALRQGLINTTKNALTPQQRVLAAHALIVRQTANAHGDFARTSSGMANQTRILRARVSDLGASIGRVLLPAALAGTRAVNRFVAQMQSGSGSGGSFVRTMRGLGGVLVTVGTAVGGVVRWFGRHRTATTVLLSVVTALTAAFVTYRAAVIAASIATRVMTAAQIALNVALTANPIGVVVVALAGLAAGLVVAYKRSATFRRIVDGAFGSVKDNARTAATVLRTVLFPSFTLIRGAADKVAGAVRAIARAFNSVKGAVGGIGGALKGAAGALNPFGEGLGKQAAGIGPLPSRGGNVTGLDGANPIMGVFASEGSRFGLHVSSGRSSHSKYTSTGNVSYHSTGEAIDLADGRGPDAAKMRAARYLAAKYGSRLAELIYSPLGFSIKNGQRVAPYAVKDHYDHVHVALDTGRPGPGDGWGRRFAGEGLGKRTRGSELGWLNATWAKVAPLWGLSAKSSPLGGLFKHISLKGSDPFVGVSIDPGSGMESAELMWPSWLWRSGKGKGEKALSDRTKTQLFIHEMAHRFQAPGAVKGTWEAEGGAEAFARIVMGRSFGGAMRSPQDPYNKFVTRVVKEHGWGWITGAQFGQAAGKRKPGTGDGIGQAVSAARKAGFKGSALVQAVAIAGAESRYRNSAKNLKPPDHSIGMWQINQLAHHGRFGSDAQLQNADANAKAAWAISDHGRNFGPWSTWPRAAAGFIARAREAVIGGRRRSAAGSTSGGGGGGQSISEMVAGAAETARNTVARQGGSSIAPPTHEQLLANTDVALAQADTPIATVNALTMRRNVLNARLFKVTAALGKRTLTPATRLRLTQERAGLLGDVRQTNQDLFTAAAGTSGDTPEPPSELDWLQAAAAEAGLTPDKADDIGAATGIRDLRARQLQFARAAGDPRGVAEFASALKDAQDALDGLTGSAQDAENAMKEHTDALNAVASELKRQTDFAQSVQSTESFQLKRALADVLSGAIAGRGIARSYAPGFGVEARY